MKTRKIYGSLAILILGIATVIGWPATSTAQSVRVNWNKSAPFSDYKTYEWIPSKNDNHPFYRQYVGEYVNYNLKKKGLRQVSADQSPDLLVTYHFLTQEMMDTETNGFGTGGWGGWGWGWGMGMGGMYDTTTTQVPRTMGLLTIDIIDARTRKIVWRGQATEDNVIKNSKGEEKDVAKSVRKMLDHFPPK